MSTKTFYHGTVAAFLPDIKKHGLQPTDKHTWKVHFDHGSGELEAPNSGPGYGPAVYLTDARAHAIEYAQTRADYFQRKPGSCFAFTSADPDAILFLSKDLDASVIHTMPILLTVTMAEVAARHLSIDENDLPASFYSLAGISTSAITKIERLPSTYAGTTVFDKKKREELVDAAFTRAGIPKELVEFARGLSL